MRYRKSVTYVQDTLIQCKILTVKKKYMTKNYINKPKHDSASGISLNAKLQELW